MATEPTSVALPAQASTVAVVPPPPTNIGGMAPPATTHAVVPPPATSVAILEAPRLRTRTFILGHLLVAVTALTAAGIATRQIDVEVAPVVLDRSIRCDLHIFFFTRKTICPPALGGTTTRRTPRNEGFLDCTAAWDKFQASFAFAIIACIIVGLSAMLCLVHVAVPRVPLFPVVVGAGITFAALTIAWPMVLSQISQENCGRKLDGTILNNQALIVDTDIGHGLILLITAWCLSTLVFLYSIWVWLTTRRVIEKRDPQPAS